CARSAPRLTARENPRLASERTASTPSNCSQTFEISPPAEPLSTMIVRGSTVCSASERRSLASRCGRLCDGTVTVGGLSGGRRECARPRLVGAGPAEQHRDREEEDPQVARQRDVLDVVELDREPLGERQLAAPEDLHRAGHPRLDAEPEPVLGAVALDEL